MPTPSVLASCVAPGEASVLKPMMMPFEVEARRISLSVILPLAA